MPVVMPVGKSACGYVIPNSMDGFSKKAISLHPPKPCVYSDLAGVIKVEGEVQGKGLG